MKTLGLSRNQFYEAVVGGDFAFEYKKHDYLAWHKPEGYFLYDSDDDPGEGPFASYEDFLADATINGRSLGECLQDITDW